MNVKTYIALNSEVHIDTQFRKHFNQLYQVLKSGLFLRVEEAKFTR